MWCLLSEDMKPDCLIESVRTMQFITYREKSPAIPEYGIAATLEEVVETYGPEFFEDDELMAKHRCVPAIHLDRPPSTEHVGSVYSMEFDGEMVRVRRAWELPVGVRGCTDLQGRFALKAAGKLEAIESAVAAMDVTDPRRMYWDRATFWREDSAMIAEFAQLLGINEEQKAALFIAARSIEV